MLAAGLAFLWDESLGVSLGSGFQFATKERPLVKDKRILNVHLSSMQDSLSACDVAGRGCDSCCRVREGDVDCLCRTFE